MTSSTRYNVLCCVQIFRWSRPERVTEGDSVRLTCKSSCALTDRATFIWYRNSQPLTERRDRNNQLLLQSVRREDQADIAVLYMDTLTSLLLFISMSRVSTESFFFLMVEFMFVNIHLICVPFRPSQERLSVYAWIWCNSGGRFSDSELQQ